MGGRQCIEAFNRLGVFCNEDVRQSKCLTTISQLVVIASSQQPGQSTSSFAVRRVEFNGATVATNRIVKVALRPICSSNLELSDRIIGPALSDLVKYSSTCPRIKLLPGKSQVSPSAMILWALMNRLRPQANRISIVVVPRN